MGDFVSAPTSSQATTNEQTAVQGGNGTTTATGVNGETAAGGSVAVHGNNTGHISISTSDPATVSRALDTVDHTIDAGAAVSFESVAASEQNTSEALAALENVSMANAQAQSNAVTTSGIIANNALPYDQGSQQSISGVGGSTTSWVTPIAIVAGVLAVVAFIKSGGRRT